MKPMILKNAADAVEDASLMETGIAEEERWPQKTEPMKEC